MSQADHIAALVALLKAEPQISELAGDRVFGIELPAEEASSMPRHTLVIRPSGGVSPVGGYVELTGERIDAISWGATPYEANRLASRVFGVLKRVRRQTVTTTEGDVLIHWAEEAGGRIAVRDADTDWPATTQPFQVLYATQHIAA